MCETLPGSERTKTHRSSDACSPSHGRLRCICVNRDGRSDVDRGRGKGQRRVNVDWWS